MEMAELVGRIQKKHNVLAIYLFGSVARGQHTRRSDIDICIIPETEDSGLELVTDIGATLQSNVDVVNFYRLPIQIRYRVFKEGKSLYEKDKKKVSLILFRTMRDYLDMKPGLERIYKAIINGVRSHG
jgi:predicted nucleotidyltransferase